MQNFINAISSFATITSTPKKTYTASPAQKFIKAATVEISSINKGADLGSWFKKENGIYRIKLRNGKRVIKLTPETDEVLAQNATDAVRVIEEAIASCQRGELDEQFKAHKIVRKVNA